MTTTLNPSAQIQRAAPVGSAAVYFAGGCGDLTALEAAGIEPVAAANHWTKAMDVCKTNFLDGDYPSNYYAVAQGNLANANALISGQGPTVSTTQNCPTPTDIAPGTLDKDGQVIGDGCFYPKQAQTIGDELTAADQSWKAYVQGMGAGTDGKPASCRMPTPAVPPVPVADPAVTTPADPTTDPAAVPPATPLPPDPYVAWRNPFVYFHSITDTPLCAQNDVGIEQLAADLKTASTTPSLSYIVPDLCHNGSDTPCAPGQPAGLAPADAFLEQVVPQIMDSAAYKDGGAIAITFDQAPQTGEHADSSGLADMPTYPNLPAIPTPAPDDPTATSPSDPAAPPTVPPTTSPPGPPTATPADPTATTPNDAPTAVAAQFGPSTNTGATAPTTPSTTPATTTPTTPTPADSGLPTKTDGGGGHVGLLLLSPYVTPGTTSAFSYYNHFSLLKTIEALFEVQELGYSKIPTLSSFDATVWTNPTGKSTPATGR